MSQQTQASSPVPSPHLEGRIRSLRGQSVMLDGDLAELYGVATKILNKAVKRNLARFPPDFMFQLTQEEAEILRFQFGTSSLAHGGRRYLPRAFTEQGVAMLSSVLRSERAVQVNVAIMRAFVRMREMMASNSELARRLDEPEARYEGRFRQVFAAIRELMEARGAEEAKQIGFRPTKGD